MNLLATLHASPALAAMLIASVLIPALTAAAHRERWDSSVTGIATLFLSTAAGFFTEWAQAGDGFRWTTAVIAALGSFIVAALTQSRVLAGTGLEAWLLALGNSMRDVTGNSDYNDPTMGVDYDEPNPTAAPPPTVESTTPVDVQPEAAAPVASPSV